ncbi:hypothetical protein B0H15DRAFT_483955 [Mycena belliarum]|uniref:SnoaL-like domain-containing protein n=1 Tax=Mycena belliarum TaxID=1033014 RepID=A0AAD6XK89_9AGAR|nr:hypothetical protein B0H15DRAFT_483955 [Mycena belliae]
MSVPDAKQLENAHALFRFLNALDWESLGELLSPECMHQYFPASINPPDGKEMRGKQDFIDVLKHNFEGIFEKVTFQPPLDVIHGFNKVVFHLRSDGISKSGKKYNNEYMITFHFDGEKIIKVNEFMDSKYSSAFFTALTNEAQTPAA